MIDSGKDIQNLNAQVDPTSRIILTLIYALIVIMSYTLMFVLMSYNFGIIMSVIVGNSIGYLLFFNTKSKNKADRSEKGLA
jgi:Na+/H+ antiporter NhaC